MQKKAFIVVLLSLLLLGLSVSATGAAVVLPDRHIAWAEVETALATAPLMFIENIGQFKGDAQYQVRGDDGTLWLADDALWISVVQPSSDPLEAELTDSVCPSVGVNLRFTFAGANPNPTLEPFDRMSTMMSYFSGNDSEKW